MVLDDLPKSHSLWFPVRHRQHIHSKSIFKLRFLVKHVDELVHVGIFFQVDDNADAFLGRLI